MVENTTNDIIKQAVIDKLEEIEKQLNMRIKELSSVNTRLKLKSINKYMDGLITARNIVMLHKNNTDKE